MAKAPQPSSCSRQKERIGARVTPTNMAEKRRAVLHIARRLIARRRELVDWMWK
jgi:hypothetical protein